MDKSANVIIDCFYFSPRQEKGEEEVLDALVVALQTENGRSIAFGHRFPGSAVLQGFSYWQDCFAVGLHNWLEEAIGEKGEL